MLLTLDIGNSNIKSAFFKGTDPVEFKVHPEIDKLINYLNEKNFSNAAICSVNPAKEKIIIDVLSKKNVSIYKPTINDELNLRINYKTRDTLGIDRVCSAVGAYESAIKKKLLKNHYLVTIDFGTATTINVVSPEKYFIGGLIAPGIQTMLKSLNENTAGLPLPDWDSYESLIGDSTNSSILSGVYNATIGMINETISHLKEINNGNQPVIFATGGNAKITMPFLKHKIFYDEALVLKGLKIIYELNK